MTTRNNDPSTEMPSNKLDLERAKWDEYYRTLELPPPGSPVLPEDAERDLLGALEALLPPGSKILEAGCGGGNQSLVVARTGKYHTSLLDFSAAALAYAKSLFAREGLPAEFIHDSAFSQGQPTYDLVFNGGVLEHYTPEEQIKLLQGMASRSRRYVMVMVPNRLCYWYWLWRVQSATAGRWPFGKEVPLADMSEVFTQAGLTFLGQRFSAVELTRNFIVGTEGIDDTLREQLLAIHDSPLIPVAQRAYILVALGSVEQLPEKEIGHLVTGGWVKYGGESHDVAELQSALADALALSLQHSMHAVTAQKKAANLEAQTAEQLRMLEEWLTTARPDDDVHTRLSRMENSWSWRLTAPLRAAAKLLRGI